MDDLEFDLDKVEALNFDELAPQLQYIFKSETDIANFNFKTFVRVFENNCDCNCLTSPTTLQFMNGETALANAHINVVITKIR